MPIQYDRPRRNRLNQTLRQMVKETHISVEHLIAPLFIVDGEKINIPIKTMPGQSRLSLDLIMEECQQLWDLGIRAISLFPAVEEKLKNSKATYAYDAQSFYLKAVTSIKTRFPDLLVMTDVALDPYSSDGHDGLVDAKTGQILNDETLEVLAKMSLAQVQAGSDILGPSDMMDGRIGVIRHCLEEGGYKNTCIMAYTAKYASAFYGPFRDALNSAPKKGDKKTYQMDYANRREARREASLDEVEGADILMVKPGLSYLDIISDLRAQSHLPIAAYNVSGEYAMVKFAAMNGAIDEQKVVTEILTSFRRAGADMILTYSAKDFALWAHS